jgi:hypothetical protein
MKLTSQAPKLEKKGMQGEVEVEEQDCSQSHVARV